MKAIAASGFILLAVIIQQVKGDYGETAWTGESGGAGLESFQNTVDKKEQNNSLFSFTSLAQSNLHISQGFIVIHIMYTVPATVPFADGEELRRILETAFLQDISPR